MPVKAINTEYEPLALDGVDKFHGNIMIHVNWEGHLMFCAPLAFALPPEMSFRKLLEETLPAAYSYHPDWSRVDWDDVRWTLDDEPFLDEDTDFSGRL